MIHELDRVVLTRDLPGQGLRAGDIGTVVFAHKGGTGYEVEFATQGSETRSVVTVTADVIRALDEHEIAKGPSFHVCQAFFPRTSPWNDLERALKRTHNKGILDHLARTVSAPFEAGEPEQVTMRMIDDEDHKLRVVKNIKKAAK
jgi:hypothetical protein